MAEAQDEIWQDISTVLKHIRFIIALTVLALAVAVITGLAAGTESRAKSEAEIKVLDVRPVVGAALTTPTLDTFRELAESDELAEAAAKQLGIDPGELKDMITVSTEPVTPLNPITLSIEAKGSSQDEAEAVASAVMAAFVTAAKELSADPQRLQSLQQQSELARERAAEFDPQPAFDLAQVQSDLQNDRRLISSLGASLAAVDRALEFVRTEGASRPLPEVLIAIAGLLGDNESGVPQASTVDEVSRGLELRRGILAGSVEDVKLDVDALALRERDLLVATADQRAALALSDLTSRDLQAANLAAEQTETEITVTASGVDSSGGAGWLARLGAAVAFGLVAGVIGAFGLELAGSWLRSRRGEIAPQEQD